MVSSQNERSRRFLRGRSFSKRFLSRGDCWVEQGNSCKCETCWDIPSLCCWHCRLSFRLYLEGICLQTRDATTSKSEIYQFEHARESGWWFWPNSECFLFFLAFWFPINKRQVYERMTPYLRSKYRVNLGTKKCKNLL